MTASDRWIASGGAYQSRLVRFSGRSSLPESARRLTDEAEYGRWEIDRSVMYWGGARRVWLRRKVLRVESTLERC